jgi:hypothetical protein
MDFGRCVRIEQRMRERGGGYLGHIDLLTEFQIADF